MKNGDDPLKALQVNVEYVVRRELDLSNRRGAEKFGIAEGSVQNFVAGRPNKTLENLARLAEKAGIRMWQLFVANLPEEPKERAALDQLVKSFLALSPKDREFVLEQAEYYRGRAIAAQEQRAT